MKGRTGHAGNNRGRQKNDWTDAQTERARELIAAKADDATFRSEIGKTKTAAYARLRYAKDPEKYRAARYISSPVPLEQPERRHVPDEVIQAAVRRAAAEAARTLTAARMGDPAPGYSALDRKQSAEASA